MSYYPKTETIRIKTMLEAVQMDTVKGIWYTFLWHVNDIKISHVNSKAGIQVIEVIETTYEKEGPLTIST